MNTTDRTQAQELQNALNDIYTAVDFGELSEAYFGRGAWWLSSKLEGQDHFDTPYTPLTTEELQTLRGALVDLSERIRKAVDQLPQE